jgi:hypothetical protein
VQCVGDFIATDGGSKGCGAVHAPCLAVQERMRALRSGQAGTTYKQGEEDKGRG